MLAALIGAGALVGTGYLGRWLRNPPTRRMVVSSLVVYPIKGGRGVEVPGGSATLTPYGLAGDRAYMLVSRAAADSSSSSSSSSSTATSSGRSNEVWTFLTPRQVPSLVRITPLLDDGNPSAVIGLEFDGDVITLDSEAQARGSVLACQLWDSVIDATDCGDDVADWLTLRINALSHTQRVVRLVALGPESGSTAARPADKARGLEDDDTEWVAWPAGERAKVADTIEAGAFSDGFPLLVLSSESVDELNARLSAEGADPVSVAHFRPNVVVSGGRPHEEDTLSVATCGSARLVFVKPCARCSVPTISPETGVRSPAAQPTKTLRGYRGLGGEVFFGMNVVHTEVGSVISVGDELARVDQDPAARVEYTGPHASATLSRFSRQ